MSGARHQPGSGPRRAHNDQERYPEPLALRTKSWENAWQVLGSNQRRLSRRFYRGHPRYF
jgi:hypothetical protein